MKTMDSLSHHITCSAGIRTRNNEIQFNSVTEFVNIIMLLFADAGKPVHCAFYVLVFIVTFCVVLFIWSHSFKIKQMGIVLKDKNIAASWYLYIR
jgi:hypothetical protein